jgi:hypothetical protein
MHSYTVSVASYMNLSILVCTCTICRCPVLHIFTPGICFFITIQPQRKAGKLNNTLHFRLYRMSNFFGVLSWRAEMILYFVLKKQLVIFLTLSAMDSLQLDARCSSFMSCIVSFYLVPSLYASYLLYTL